MVKESWSIDKQKAEKAKREQIKAERIRHFNIIKNSPAFTVVRILSLFDIITRAPKDIVTMQNGDTYKGPRADVEKLISLNITQKVDEILGLKVTHSILI